MGSSPDLHRSRRRRHLLPAVAVVTVLAHKALGNGFIRGIRDVIYVRPQRFERARTPEIAREIGEINAALRQAHRPFLLVGPGRWGSADPWLGIPVQWPQISGARAIVEADLPARPIDKGVPSAELLAQIVANKYCDHLPLYRQGKMFERAGVKIADSTLGEWLRASVELVAPLILV